MTRIGETKEEAQNVLIFRKGECRERSVDSLGPHQKELGFGLEIEPL